jgi:hypothetical protein
MKLSDFFKSKSTEPTYDFDTKEGIERWLIDKHVDNFTIHDDLVVDVDGDVNIACSKPALTEIPFQFGTVNGRFDIRSNNLTSLKGCPTEVGADFNCSENQLTTLEFGPKEVGENYYCDKNKLTSLEGAPREITENFTCGVNLLETLKGAPREVGKSFICTHNKLTTLEFLPKIIRGNLHCNTNKFGGVQPDTSMSQIDGRVFWRHASDD